MAKHANHIFFLLQYFFLLLVNHVKHSVAAKGHPHRSPAQNYHQGSDVDVNITSRDLNGPSGSDYTFNGNWSMEFFTGSCCTALGAAVDVYEEANAPWKEGCRSFNNYTSVWLTAKDCMIYLYRDNECKVSLEGAQTQFYPGTDMCWMKLTTDKGRRNSRKCFENWSFSGSWKVDCTPAPHPNQIDVNIDLEDSSASKSSIVYPPRVDEGTGHIHDSTPHSDDHDIDADLAMPSLVAKPLSETSTPDINFAEYSITKREPETRQGLGKDDHQQNHGLVSSSSDVHGSLNLTNTTATPSYNVTPWFIMLCPNLFCPTPCHGLRIFNESKNGECLKWEHMSSVYVRPGNCTISVFKDRKCRTLVDDPHAVYGPVENAGTCVKVASNPSESKGSLSVICPENTLHSFDQLGPFEEHDVDIGRGIDINNKNDTWDLEDYPKDASSVRSLP